MKQSGNMVVGLTGSEVETFLDFLIKANNVQIKAMLTSLQGELKKRELVKGNSFQVPNSKEEDKRCYAEENVQSKCAVCDKVIDLNKGRWYASNGQVSCTPQHREQIERLTKEAGK